MKKNSYTSNSNRLFIVCHILTSFSANSAIQKFSYVTLVMCQLQNNIFHQRKFWNLHRSMKLIYVWIKSMEIFLCISWKLCKVRKHASYVMQAKLCKHQMTRVFSSNKIELLFQTKFSSSWFGRLSETGYTIYIVHYLLAFAGTFFLVTLWDRTYSEPW